MSIKGAVKLIIKRNPLSGAKPGVKPQPDAKPGHQTLNKFGTRFGNLVYKTFFWRETWERETGRQTLNNSVPAFVIKLL